MDKKDIYEHLAKIYLDASSDKTRKKIPSSKVYKNLFFASVAVLIISLGLTLLTRFNKIYRSETALVLLSEAAKINFHFDPARKETYSVDLNKLNLSKYRSLCFSLKKANYKTKIAMRVEFANTFREKSEVYVQDIPASWQDFKLKFSAFRNLSDWTEMSKLIFTVEEWNTGDKKGIVYIDNIRLIR